MDTMDMEKALKTARSEDSKERTSGLRQLTNLLQISDNLSLLQLTPLLEYCLDLLLTLMEENEAEDVEATNFVKATKKYLAENVSDMELAKSDFPHHAGGLVEFSSRYKTEFDEIEKLGSGGFGKVYKCKNKLDEKHYAVKMIPLRKDHAKISREVKALAGLQHQHIVRYYQAWIEKGVEYVSSSDDEIPLEQASETVDMLYIQMEFCTKTLTEVMSNELERHMVWHYFRQMVEGLCHIHEHGYIHRDLTRDNIFVDSLDNIKIGDFGLAKIFTANGNGSPITSGTDGVGNKLYQAPEMSMKNPKINYKVDIYSLGLVLVEMLNFCDTNMERVKVIGDARKGIFPPTMAAEEISLLMKLLAESSSQRLSAPQLLEKLNVKGKKGQVLPLDTDE